MSEDPKPLTREEVQELSDERGHSIFINGRDDIVERLCADWLRMEAELNKLRKENDRLDALLMNEVYKP